MLGSGDMEMNVGCSSGPPLFISVPCLDKCLLRKLFNKKYIVMAWTGIGMKHTVLLRRKLIANHSHRCSKGVGSTLPRYPGYCSSIYVYRQANRWVESKDHVATRLRTSEKEVNENNIPNCNWERNPGSQNVNYMNQNVIGAARQKFTTQPDGMRDGSLEPLANWSRTGLFVSTNEKLQTTEHHSVCWKGKEMRACFIVVGFQKCPLF